MHFLSILLFSAAASSFPTGGRVRLPRQEEEAEDPNKLDLTAQFDAAVTLQGGDVQQDTTFPPGINGVLEIEFANAEGRTLTVTENKTPPAPPSGFVAIEPSSYVVALSGGSADNLTLSKVDYILNANNSLDISQGQIGRLCTETNTFVIDPALGELEFEAEENELTLSVANMNAEWGIFLPQTATAGNTTATPTTGTEVATTTSAAATAGTSGTLLDLLLGLFGR